MCSLDSDKRDLSGRQDTWGVGQKNKWETAGQIKVKKMDS